MRRMGFLSLIVFGILAWSLPLCAQKSAVPVIGFLTTSSPSFRGGREFAAFQDGLREEGYIEGNNVRIEYRWAGGHTRLPEFAADLVSLRVDVIVAAGGHLSAVAAHNATKEIPIVFTTVTDPVKIGLVKDINDPGGNATGMAGLTSELDPKRLEFLHALKPTARVIGVLENPQRPRIDSQLRELQAAADKMNLKLEIQKAAAEEEIDSAFQAFASKRVDALLVAADALFNNLRKKVLSLAALHSLPAIYQWPAFAKEGGLMSYGPILTEAYFEAGQNAGKILNGDKPANMAVKGPTKFPLIINRKTAHTLNVIIPPDIFAVACLWPPDDKGGNSTDLHKADEADDPCRDVKEPLNSTPAGTAR